MFKNHVGLVRRHRLTSTYCITINAIRKNAFLRKEKHFTAVVCSRFSNQDDEVYHYSSNNNNKLTAKNRRRRSNSFGRRRGAFICTGSGTHDSHLLGKRLTKSNSAARHVGGGGGGGGGVCSSYRKPGGKKNDQETDLIHHNTATTTTTHSLHTGTIEGGLVWSGDVIQTERAKVDVVVIGGGQSGLSVGFNLSRLGIDHVILDGNQHAGGAWLHRWDGCTLFSTRKWSSLPGLTMASCFNACEHGYPSAMEMAGYLAQYEALHSLNVLRPVMVSNVSRAIGCGKILVDCTVNHGRMTAYPTVFEAKAVVSAAGTHSSPYIPSVPGMGDFQGIQMHSSEFRGRQGLGFAGKKIIVVGGGNSGAQVMAELAHVAAELVWCTAGPPTFLCENITGRDIFDTVAAIRKGRKVLVPEDIPSLSKIVQVDSVREAKKKGVYENHRLSFSSVTPTGVKWADGSHMEVDVIIWATGFNANTLHVQGMSVTRCPRGEFAVTPGAHEMVSQPGVFAMGYGHWTGVGSASIPGAGYYAKRVVDGVARYIFGHVPVTVRPKPPIFRVPYGSGITGGGGTPPISRLGFKAHLAPSGFVPPVVVRPPPPPPPRGAAATITAVHSRVAHA